jgi:hypothetical protein
MIVILRETPQERAVREAEALARARRLLRITPAMARMLRRIR